MDRAKTVKIANVPTPAAPAEVRWQVSKNCKALSIQCRTAVDVIMAYEEGKAGGLNSPYYTIKSGAILRLTQLDIENGDVALYFSAASAVVVEIVTEVEEDEE